MDHYRQRTHALPGRPQVENQGEKVASVAETVHYVESTGPVCRAGIITGLDSVDNTIVNLTVIVGVNPYTVDAITYEGDTYPAGTWHHPDSGCGN